MRDALPDGLPKTVESEPTVMLNPGPVRVAPVVRAALGSRSLINGRC